jgi:hypothetical protein
MGEGAENRLVQFVGEMFWLWERSDRTQAILFSSSLLLL